MAQYNSGKSPYKTAKELQVEKTILEIRQGVRVLVLMRGLPGSGKSYLAKEILKKALDSTDYATFIYSTDDYFINPLTGKYVFDKEKLSDAHQNNRLRAFHSMACGVSPVIIDNTNLRTWEMGHYVQAAVSYRYLIEIVEPYTKWALNVNELARRNLHNVHLEKLQFMLEKYDKSITVESLLKSVGVEYKQPPLYRRYPQLFELPTNFMATGQIQPFDDSNADLTNSNSKASSPDVIYISDDEGHQEHTWSSAQLQGKHNLTTSSSALESDTKKARTYSLGNEKPPTSSKTASEIHKARNVYPELNLASWGLNENAVSSWEAWDIVNPIKHNKELEDEIVFLEDTNSGNKETLDVATNTHSSDFTLLSKQPPSVQIKILTTNNRDINEGFNINLYPDSPPKRTLLHKSSMTDDVFFAEELVTHDDKKILELISVFPDIPFEYLRDLFEKCQGDIDWVLDLLLDDTREILPIKKDICNDSTNTESSSTIVGDNLPENMQDLKLNDSLINVSPVKKDTSTNEVAELQKHVENVFAIDQNHYSEHVLKLKGRKQLVSNNHPEKLFESPETTTRNPDFEDLSTPKVPLIMPSSSDSDSDIDSSHNENDNEEIIELNLGENLISQLEAKLGFMNVMPDGFLSVVQVPISLARQLYVTYVESILGQMEIQNQVLETIVKQDEDFALKLQQQEQAGMNGIFEIADLSEIMNEQVACNIYQKDVEQWKNETPDNLATKMTLQKLYATFPRINTQTIMEIYHAYNNSYSNTVEVLLASTDYSSINDPDGTFREPPITEAIVTEMKKAESELKNCVNTPDIPKSAQEYRDEASMHHKKHTDLIFKAWDAYRRKQYPVAQFYSDIARSHTQLYDQANNLAASAFLNEHSQKLQNFHTLDLHFLYVKEATSALDMFIDQNIQLLNAKKPSENLFIITGRGKRSEQGRSKLKPVIMARLRKRKIRYWELNPGLLKIRVLQTSLLTSDI